MKIYVICDKKTGKPVQDLCGCLNQVMAFSNVRQAEINALNSQTVVKYVPEKGERKHV